ncbi:SDR family oxidoreductase [[Mycobacterium] crassicus]|uniref:NAD(P)H-binding protein n=1 Tax=[Mycobacterium] crassicus TaxID=2872309 RepID=A0ABU5XKJ1_9MYCO|nr:NAD(P)H-binding protein [Mycolicibacter sp. MYC098]MEB3022777.1 NAD(P)H-binding protein [Mycolicibacter sp. MYC098]
MVKRVLVAGGTGRVGRIVVQRLHDAGAQVRVLSRGRHRADSASAVQYVTGDVTTGAGLAEALDGVDAVVACVDPMDHLVPAALAAGTPHLVYISIVGIEKVPFSYYQRKLADEKLIAESGVPWTVLRTTQFHDFVGAGLRMLAKSPVMPLPAGWSFQPVDAREVGAALAELALGEPAGRVPDMGGPEVLSVGELAGLYLAAVGKHRLRVPLPVPGRVGRAFRSGAHLAPDRAVGAVPFARYLDETGGRF